MAKSKIPQEALHTLDIVRELFTTSLVGVYLYGSAVGGGLKKDSDVDVFVIINTNLHKELQKELTTRLMNISQMFIYNRFPVNNYMQIMIKRYSNQIKILFLLLQK